MGCMVDACHWHTSLTPAPPVAWAHHGLQPFVRPARVRRAGGRHADVPLRQSHRLARRAGRSEGAGGLRLVRPACRPVARPDRLGARRPSPLGRALAVPTSDRELTDQPAPEGSPPAPPRWGLGDVVLAVVVALFASSLLFGVWDAF